VTRRGLFLLAARKDNETPTAPTDVYRINEFAGAFNAYVERLNAGVVALELWPRVWRAWGRMTK
jgi:hypothetical protein